jgi:cytochrome c553
MLTRTSTALLSAPLLVAGAQADERAMALGRHLAQECVTCHKPGGTGGANIPPIAGLEVDYFVKTMGFYRTGARNNPAMVSVALSLDDEQVKALAIYFASQPKGGAPEPAQASKEPAGKSRKR